MSSGTIGLSRLLFGTLLALTISLPDTGLARQIDHHADAAKMQAKTQRNTQRSSDKPSAPAVSQARSQASPQERTPFTQAEAEDARPEGLPGGLRIAGDDASAFQSLIDGASAAADPWLVLSGGGENGAYAAGILNGWSRAGDRPVFGVITGVSTGALIAPFAFVGSSADPALKASYTEITAADVFEFGGTGAALTDTWPLRERIETSVTRDLLRAIAAEHAKGRRLLIATTQVETERPVLWDMGAIATVAAQDKARESKALKLFREVILASTAVPGVFPPVMIDAMTAQGKVIQEMHDDGGAMNPFFLAPASAIDGTSAIRLPARTIYLIVNNRLTPDFALAPRTVLGVLGGTMSAAIKAQTRAALTLTATFAARAGLDLRVAAIDGRFTKTSPGPFDEAYMKALFEHGQALARAGTAFGSAQGAGSSAAAPSRPGDAATASEDRSVAQR